MIKIIKEGNTPLKICIFNCTVCGCIFEMNLADIEDCDTLSPTITRYNKEVVYKCKCPFCKHRSAYGRRKEE